jgi:hypothetical protein
MTLVSAQTLEEADLMFAAAWTRQPFGTIGYLEVRQHTVNRPQTIENLRHLRSNDCYRLTSQYLFLLSAAPNDSPLKAMRRQLLHNGNHGVLLLVPTDDGVTQEILIDSTMRKAVGCEAGEMVRCNSSIAESA